jgi:hypothetical protein
MTHAKKGMRSGSWLVIVFIIATIIGSIAVFLFLLNYRNNALKASRQKASSKPASVKASKKAVSTNTTKLGPYGIESSAIIAENKLPGTTAWKIPPNTNTTTIAGFTDHPQARLGQTVTVYVSTTAPSFVIDAYRMGYYQGKGARLVWHSPSIKGTEQPSCPASPPLYMVQCNWSPSYKFTITKAFFPGDYLLKLTGSQGQESYIPLTVWDPNSHAAYVVMNAVFTWQAFNPYGGYDLYQGGPPNLVGYPPPDRSRVLSFDRPYGYGNGAANFLTNEYPLVRFMEKHGLDVTYWTNITLAVHGNLLTNHKALLSLGHDEEWSYRMRKWAVYAHSKGVNLIFFGASPILRKVRLQASPLGPNLEVVNYRDPQADPLYGKDNQEVTQNWWGQPPANLPASTLVGASYIGYNNNQSFPMVVTDPSSWLYRNTGLHAGSQIPGVEMYDFDQYLASRPNPPGVQILAHSPVVIGFSGQHMYADTTYWTDPTSKAGVFESGTNFWIAAMDTCNGANDCPEPLVRKMTGNILWLFGQGPTGNIDPSTSNVSNIYK